jgi:RNA polymerase sigma-54 factor
LLEVLEDLIWYGRKVSNHTLRQTLRETIHKEDKQSPLSDDAIARHFKKIGFSCARRTITKYRQSLSIPAASKRRQWN